jgi:NAD(P)-dependent dehydrogenase (short-subunit alcohol dehydrogenase family)
MPNLSGKTVLVTGATSGIGLEASVELAKRGATVVLVGRAEKKGKAAQADVVARSGSQKVELLLCDFSSQRQIRKLASDYRAKHNRLDILINNAGTVSDTRVLTEDGIEQTFAVNHLGYFLLTNLLLDLVQKSAPARIVNVASIGHRHADIDFENLHYEKGGYFIMKAYGRSKLANVLFTAELGRRLQGKGVTVNCLHPGAVATPIWQLAPWYSQPILAIAKFFMLSPAEGGSRIVYLATSDEVKDVSGEYFESNRRVSASARGRDRVLAEKLWEVSARLVGGVGTEKVTMAATAN